MIKYHPASAINNNIKISARIIKYWIWSNIMKSYEIIKDSVDPKRRPFFITWICFRNHPQNHTYSSYSLDINCPSSGCSIFLTISRSFRSLWCSQLPVASIKSMDFAMDFSMANRSAVPRPGFGHSSSSALRWRPGSDFSRHLFNGILRGFGWVYIVYIYIYSRWF